MLCHNMYSSVTEASSYLWLNKGNSRQSGDSETDCVNFFGLSHWISDVCVSTDNIEFPQHQYKTVFLSTVYVKTKRMSLYN